jgi:flavin-binding protein dodecin
MVYSLLSLLPRDRCAPYRQVWTRPPLLAMAGAWLKNRAVKAHPVAYTTGGFMSDHVYKSIELTGSSTTTVEDAVRNAIARAGKTVHHLRWFEVSQVRGHIEDGAIAHWQVTMKVGFTLDA